MKRMILCLAALGLLTACQTMEGFGKDVRSAGTAIQDEAADAQQ